MKRINTLGVAAILALATACSNTAKGVEKDAENAGENVAAATDRAAEATATTADSAGANISAAMETADVKTALLADSRISADNINVDSDKAQRTVTLNGHVPSAAQKKIATEIAQAKAPEWKIVNNLTIKPD
ncbi:MAG: BON domain-containing protein [Gemmatimonadota bacterium]